MIEIDPLPGSVAGDPVRVSARGSRLTCAARHHDGGEARKVDLRIFKGAFIGEFTPDRPGRWWVAFKGDRETKEACFWVSPRRVQF